jgi:hypothetical protein
MTIRSRHSCWASCAALWSVPRLLVGMTLSGGALNQEGPPSSSPAGCADAGGNKTSVMAVACWLASKRRLSALGSRLSALTRKSRDLQMRTPSGKLVRTVDPHATMLCLCALGMPKDSAQIQVVRDTRSKGQGCAILIIAQS